MTLVHLHDYSSDYVPAMPVVSIQVGRRVSQQSLALEAIVDSGSDGTMIPLRYLNKLDARKVGTNWLSGTAGGRIKVDIFAVFIKIGAHDPIYVNVVGTQLDEVILGRDVLNQFAVNLNGLAQSVEISTG